MHGAEPTPSPARAGAAPGPSPAAPGSAPGSRRRRLSAALAAVALPLTMLAPWYSLRVSARGLSGRHTSVQQLTGWDALSVAGIVCVLVAVCICALILTRALSRVSGLGAATRRAARARVDGALVAVGGLLCIAALLWTSISPPATAGGAVAISAHTGVRWGVLLAIGVAAILTAIGVQIAAAAGRRLRDLRSVWWAANGAPQPAPGRSTSENSALSTPTIRIPSTISQRKRVM